MPFKLAHLPYVLYVYCDNNSSNNNCRKNDDMSYLEIAKSFQAYTDSSVMKKKRQKLKPTAKITE